MQFKGEPARLGPARGAKTRVRLLAGVFLLCLLGAAGKQSVGVSLRLAKRWANSKLAPGATVPQAAWRSLGEPPVKRRAPPPSVGEGCAKESIECWVATPLKWPFNALLLQSGPTGTRVALF